ncbi:MAG: glycoside hydrolase family 2 [Prevotellaceae bacterium]|jgi:hypothetical protein|nr:glycoside hydrolase family 2 [Prevotellaceae bacterium]
MIKERLTCFLCRALWLFTVSCSFSVSAICRQPEDLAQKFIVPPVDVATGVYWYWITDNISKEGVVNDLHAMKKAGINRAYIGNIGEGADYGTVKIFSDEWWDILHTALKTATELDITIGIFNSPGWSQSGGPWVKPEEAMRYLAMSELRVKGPLKFAEKLEKPVELFQDVKVIAYPAPADEVWRLPEPIKLDSVYDISFDEPKTVHSLSVRPVKNRINASAVFEAQDSDGTYRTLAEFNIERMNTALHVGFDPYAPVTITIPETTSSRFRLTLENHTPNNLIDIELNSVPRVERYSEKTLAKMHPTPLPYWHDYQWRTQPEPAAHLAIDPASVVDLTAYMQPDGTLTWDVPAGEWVILRTGMTPTGTTNAPASPEATGYEIDKMSKTHIQAHFRAYLGDIMARIPKADRKSFKVVVADSYETGGQNFTDGFLEEFKQRYGYDALPYLPAYNGYVVGSQMNSDRFLWDMRRMVADKVAYDYVGGLREISHRHGLTTWLENYGHWGFPSEFLMYGGQSDEIAGEFWSEGDLGDIENRAASSCGHIYGKTKIWSESNTSAGNPFGRYPGVIKQRGDRFFSEGINSTLLHVYVTQPYEDKNPGMNAWFGTEFNRKNTWFSQIDLYTSYLKRANFMLQQGLNVADAAYFIGEDAPKMTGVTDPPLPAGYQFDYINAEVIEKYMTVKNGLLTLPHGTQYRILVLPKMETMRPELLKHIMKLVRDGGVVLGPPPSRSPSLQNQPEADRQVQQMAAELWGKADSVNVKYARYGKGAIINGMNMTEAFQFINLRPDCFIPGENGKSVLYNHRTMKNGEIFFLTNQTDTTIQLNPVWFRINQMKPELWHPVTGEIRELHAFENRNGETGVPLQLAPLESVFIVFRQPANRTQKLELPDIALNYPTVKSVQPLTNAWTVTFDTTMRGPAEPVVFDTLQDWSQHSDERIRYYSGAAIYKTTLSLSTRHNDFSAPQHIFLDLGKVTAMAKVKINGQYAGGVWTAPYRLDITKWVKNGENDIEIEVVNTWVNRLIGDQTLPPEQRRTWCPVNNYEADSPLHPSGLVGPVTVLTCEF